MSDSKYLRKSIVPKNIYLQLVPSVTKKVTLRSKNVMFVIFQNYLR